MLWGLCCRTDCTPPTHVPPPIFLPNCQFFAGTSSERRVLVKHHLVSCTASAPSVRLNCSQCILHKAQCAVYSVQCKLYIVKCTVYSVKSKVYSVHYTVHSAQFTALHCTTLNCTALHSMLLYSTVTEEKI